LEILVALAVVFCKGQKKANIREAVLWFSQIGKSQCVVGEDPAEDVFVSLAQDINGNYRLLEGVRATGSVLLLLHALTELPFVLLPSTPLFAGFCQLLNAP